MTFTLVAYVILAVGIVGRVVVADGLSIEECLARSADSGGITVYIRELDRPLEGALACEAALKATR